MTGWVIIVPDMGPWVAGSHLYGWGIASTASGLARGF